MAVVRLRTGCLLCIQWLTSNTVWAGLRLFWIPTRNRLVIGKVLAESIIHGQGQRGEVNAASPAVALTIVGVIVLLLRRRWGWGWCGCIQLLVVCLSGKVRTGRRTGRRLKVTGNIAAVQSLVNWFQHLASDVRLGWGLLRRNLLVVNIARRYWLVLVLRRRILGRRGWTYRLRSCTKLLVRVLLLNLAEERSEIRLVLGFFHGQLLIVRLCFLLLVVWRLRRGWFVIVFDTEIHVHIGATACVGACIGQCWYNGNAQHQQCPSKAWSLRKKKQHKNKRVNWLFEVKSKGNLFKFTQFRKGQRNCQSKWRCSWLWH